MANSSPTHRTCFPLHKGEFWDAICLRYNWALKNTPTTCSCGATFSIDHAMICHSGGFPTIRHNEIRDITASLLTEVCHSVATEPPLQSLSGELLNPRSANREDGARLDIRARHFWNGAHGAFFDVRVFHPNASSYRSMSLQGAFRRHEQAKKRESTGNVCVRLNMAFSPLSCYPQLVVWAVKPPPSTNAWLTSSALNDRCTTSRSCAG